MNYNDDSYAAMLLTMTLSPNREEYARPFSVAEFRRMEALVRSSSLRRVGDLLDLDISGMMMTLGIPEEEAYRAFTLLHRSVQLSYAIESFMKQGIDVITCFDAEYPPRLRRKLRDMAPPVFFRCGVGEFELRPAVAILGISGVRTGEAVREAVEGIVGAAVERGYTVVTGGELGVSRVAAAAVERQGGRLLDVLGGGMLEHIHLDGIAELIACEIGRAHV